MAAMVFYICNQKNPLCMVHNHQCFDCKHTINPLYSKFGECRDPENHPERFEAEVFDIGNGKTAKYYWERIPENNVV